MTDPASPDQALQSVLDAMTEYTAEPELGTFAAVMEAVTRYGRACRQDEQQLSLAEVTCSERRSEPAEAWSKTA